MKKYEVVVEDEGAGLLTDLLNSLPYVKQVHQSENIDACTLASEKGLSEDWFLEEDNEFQKLYS